MNRVQLSTTSIQNSNFNFHSSLFLRFLSYFRFSKKMNDLFVLIQSLTMFNFKYVFRLNFLVSCSFVFCTTHISSWNVCFCFTLHKNSINYFLITHILRFELVIIENWNIYSHLFFESNYITESREFFEQSSLFLNYYKTRYLQI